MNFRESLSKKRNPEGLSEILLRVVVSRNKMYRVKSGVFINPDLWLNEDDIDRLNIKRDREKAERDSKRGRKATKKTGKEIEIPTYPYIDMIGGKQKLSSLNSYGEPNDEAKQADKDIKTIEKLIDDYKHFTNSNLTADDINLIVDKYHNPDKYKEPEKDDKINTIGEAINLLIDEAPTRLVGRKQLPVKPQTIFQYKQLKNHYSNYLSHEKKRDLNVLDANKCFFDSFVCYLNGIGLSLNTVGKMIKNLRRALKLLPQEQRVKIEMLDSEICIKPSENVDNVYLSESELKKLADVELTGIQDIIRDQFLLLCWSGCRYSDLNKLNKDNIYKSAKGYKVLKLRQQKTGNDVVIPFLSEIERIFDKYGYEMPKVMASQTFNETIKTVCLKAGIDERTELKRTIGGKETSTIYKKYEVVSAHTGRRSFATNLFLRGMPSISIMRITGHKTEESFLKYIKMSAEENAEKVFENFMLSQAN